MNYIFIGIIIILYIIIIVKVSKREHRNWMLVIGSILVFIDLILTLTVTDNSNNNLLFNMGLHIFGLIGLLITEKAEIKNKDK